MLKCKFCNIINDPNRRKNEEIIYENDNFIVITDKYRKTSIGAICLIIPKLHEKNILELSKEKEVTQLIKLISKSMQKAYKCNGIRVWTAINREAGQSIFHCHIHIVPCNSIKDRFIASFAGVYDLIKRIVTLGNSQLNKKIRYEQAEKIRKEIMPLTKKLVLEKPTPKDFHRFYEINSDPENNLFNPHGAMSYEVAKEVFHKILEHWENYDFGVWSIAEKSNPNYKIGFGGLSNRYYGDEIKLNLGFRLDKKYWGKGYATELAKTAIEFGFENLKQEAIYGLVRPKNVASVKVLEKCGMKIVDTLDDVPNEEKSLVFKIENKTKESQ